MEYLVKNASTSHWFDDVSTPNVKEDAFILMRKSLHVAIEVLKTKLGSDIEQWKFSKIHRLNAKHMLGSVLTWLNYPDLPVSGWRHCVVNIGASVDSGPCWRQILNFSDLNSSLCIFPGGQSGNPFSSHYYDQLEMWVKGEYKNMSFPVKPEDVKNAESTLEFISR
ncbi:MAG: penicillin acylase family protein [Candidatus Baldrarchaeota archaeon]